MSVIVILIFIVAVIVLGYFLKINFGLLGIVFAFIGGCLVCGFAPNMVIGFWPTRLFFQMFSVTFFYAFALNNGTLEHLTKKLVYAARNTTFLIPIILFLVGGVLAGIGPGSISMFLILIPIFSQVIKQVGLHPAMTAIIVATGVNAGAWSPIAVNGITIRGLIETAGYSAAEASAYGAVVWRNCLIASVIMFAIGYVVFRAWKCKAYITERPEGFTKQQKISVGLIVILTLLLVIPPVFNALIGGPFFSWLNSNMDATFLAIIFGVLSVVFKLGEEKKAIASVPWGTIIMVCGMGMLISVAAEAGAMAYLSDFITQSFAAPVIPIVMVIVAGVMSIFSSTMGVVVPTLYPIIYAICIATGASPAVLFSVVPISAAYTGTSPFSLFGGLVMASADEKVKSKLFLQLLLIAGISLVIIIILTAVGVIAN